MRKLTTGSIVAFAAALLLGWIILDQYMNSPIKAISSPYSFEVPEGSSLNSVAYSLAAVDIVGWPRAFVFWGRLRGDAHRLKAGEYLLDPEISPNDILDQLVEGRVRLYPVTLVEGWTKADFHLAPARR